MEELCGPLSELVIMMSVVADKDKLHRICVSCLVRRENQYNTDQLETSASISVII